MTHEEFKANVGREPEQDDLDRANCPHAGVIGHWACGVCEDHKKPVFACLVCFPLAADPDNKIRRVKT